VVLAMVASAALPVASLGIVAAAQVDRALSSDAILRTDRAVDAAAADLRRLALELDGLAESYASWPAFVDDLATGDLDEVRNDVLSFLVERGSVAAGVVVSPQGDRAAGDPEIVALLANREGDVVRADTGGQAAWAGSALVIAAARTIGGADHAGQYGEILLARRLDAATATTLSTLTGYDVSFLDPQGNVAISTDPTLAQAAVPLVLPTTATVRAGDLVARRMHLGGPGVGADMVLATRVSALQSTEASLPPLLLGLLATTVGLAVLFAIVLSRILQRRLNLVHDGLAAMADGRVAPPISAGGDEIDRLAAGLRRLVETLDRRETVVRRSLAAAAAIPIQTTPGAAAHALAGDTVSIFGGRWARLVGADGRPVGSFGDPGDLLAADQGPERGRDLEHGTADPATTALVAEVPLGLGADARRLELGLAPGQQWLDGDQANLEVMGLVAGSVLDQVGQFGAVSGRADRLDRLNRLQRGYIGAVSHNLRAPLARIELAASDLVERSTDPLVTDRAALIRSAERGLARVVGQMLVLSRMDSGTLGLEDEPVALRPLIESVVRDLEISDRVVIEDGARGIVAIADQGAVEQSLWILLDNARRYAPTGTITVSLAASATPNGEPRLHVLVADEGPGVAAGEEQRVFRRFSRGSATGEGMGIGLSIARGLARAMGGDVILGRATRGAVFDLALPSSGHDTDPAEGAARG
jgi:signal transduction histidine kinase